jgi:protein phosphatase 1G
LKTEADRIKKAGGEIYMGRVNGNLNLTRAIGDLEYKTNKKLPPEEQIITANPEIIKVKNENIDLLVMGCDGIWEVKSNSDITGFIKARLS